MRYACIQCTRVIIVINRTHMRWTVHLNIQLCVCSGGALLSQLVHNHERSQASPQRSLTKKKLKNSEGHVTVHYLRWLPPRQQWCPWMDATLAWYSFESKETLWKIGKQATSATSATGSGLNKSVSLQHRLPEELACLGHQDAINIPSEPSPSRHSCFKSEVQFLLSRLSKKPLTAKSLVGSDEAAFPLEDYLSNKAWKSNMLHVEISLSTVSYRMSLVWESLRQFTGFILGWCTIWPQSGMCRDIEKAPDLLGFPVDQCGWFAKRWAEDLLKHSAVHILTSKWGHLWHSEGKKFKSSSVALLPDSKSSAQTQGLQTRDWQKARKSIKGCIEVLRCLVDPFTLPWLVMSTVSICKPI